MYFQTVVQKYYLSIALNLRVMYLFHAVHDAFIVSNGKLNELI